MVKKKTFLEPLSLTFSALQTDFFPINKRLKCLSNQRLWSVSSGFPTAMTTLKCFGKTVNLHKNIYNLWISLPLYVCNRRKLCAYFRFLNLHTRAPQDHHCFINERVKECISGQLTLNEQLLKLFHYYRHALCLNLQTQQAQSLLKHILGEIIIVVMCSPLCCSQQK